MLTTFTLLFGEIHVSLITLYGAQFQNSGTHKILPCKNECCKEGIRVSVTSTTHLCMTDDHSYCKKDPQVFLKYKTKQSPSK